MSTDPFISLLTGKQFGFIFTDQKNNRNFKILFRHRYVTND